MDPIIRYDHVTVSVRNQVILSDLSFTVRAGEKAVFRGRSGAGKSTVLKTLLGLYPIGQGRIFFAGRLLDKSTITAIRRCTSYIGQEPILGADTVREALMLPFHFKAHRQRPPADAALRDALARVRLTPDILDRACLHVSGGEKQRIAVARAQLLGKHVYLVDEITSALDDETKLAVIDILLDPQLTVLSVAHDASWIARCETIYDLQDGSLIQVLRHGHS